MEQETNTIHHHHGVDEEVARVSVFNLPLFDLLLNVTTTTSTATSQKEEAVVENENHNAVIKATDETKYSVEEEPLEMQQNDQSKPRERERETLYTVSKL